MMQTYAKAITAVLLAFLGALATAYGDNHVTGREWVTIAIATVVAGSGVFAVPNTRTRARRVKGDPA